MDIDLLSKMVKELILDNDRVVLPGLGCFVAEMVSSTFSDKGYTINPPYRKLYFRAKPDEGDALTKFYAKTNKVEMEVADKIIMDFVAELKSVLFTKKTVIFPGLGRMRATKENNVFFISDEELDIYPAGFGLEPISLKTHQESAEEVSAAVVGLRSILNETVNDLHTEPDPVPVVELNPVPAAEPVPDPEHEPVTSPDPVVVLPAEPDPIPEPAPDPNPEPASGPEPEPVPDPNPDPVKDPDPDSGRNPVRKAVVAIVIIVMSLALLLAAYVAVGHWAPELLDKILYTPEELEILNYKSE